MRMVYCRIHERGETPEEHDREIDGALRLHLIVNAVLLAVIFTLGIVGGYFFGMAWSNTPCHCLIGLFKW